MLPRELFVAVNEVPKREIGSLLQGVPPEMEYTGRVLSQNIEGELIKFPIVTVNPNDPFEKHISIAYVYPLRPEVLKPGGQALARLAGEIINEAQPRLLLAVRPPTEKSGGLNKEAIKILQREFPQLTIYDYPMPGGRDVFERGMIDNVTKQTELENGLFFWQGRSVETNEFIKGYSYLPVTEKAKSVWLEPKDCQVGSLVNEAGIIILFDDLITTGNTARAVEKAWINLGGVSPEKIFTVALGWEGENVPQLPSNWRAATRFPEWIGAF